MLSLWHRNDLTVVLWAYLRVNMTKKLLHASLSAFVVWGLQGRSSEFSEILLIHNWLMLINEYDMWLCCKKTFTIEQWLAYVKKKTTNKLYPLILKLVLFDVVCRRVMLLRKRWCFLLSRGHQHFGCLARRRRKHLPCVPPQMDSLHQRKTMFHPKCILLLHCPLPMQEGNVNTNFWYPFH